MKNTLSRRLFPGALLAAALTLAPLAGAGCGRSHALVVASPYNAPELAVEVEQIRLSGDKLELKLLFVNRTPNVMMVDRNQIKLRVGTQVVPRYAGRFGGGAPHMIAPAMSHKVYVDYIVGDGFAGPATLALSEGGVIVNGATLPVPDFTVTVTPTE
jgi:hypothetical protein